MTDDLVKRYRQMQEAIGGCSDGYCVIKKTRGMHTNGGCNCLMDLKLHEASRVGHLLRYAQEMADRIEELEDKLEKVVEELRTIRDAPPRPTTLPGDPPDPRQETYGESHD